MFSSFLPFDSSVFQWVADVFSPGNNPFLDRFFLFFTMLGNGGWFWIVLAVLFLIPNKTRKIGVVMAFALILNGIGINLILKPLFARPRPFLLDLPDWVAQYKIWFPNGPLVSASEYAFPSGHAAVSFAGAFAWCFASRRDWVNRARWVSFIGIAAAAVIAFSRVFIGVHYMTDILAGALAGTLCALFGYLIFRRIEGPFGKIDAPWSRFNEKRLPKAFK